MMKYRQRLFLFLEDSALKTAGVLKKMVPPRFSTAISETITRARNTLFTVDANANAQWQ